MKAARQRWHKATGWVIPPTYAAATLVAAMTFPRLEYPFLPNSVSPMSAPAAMGV